jgi:NAD(P)-dependent dehydrogenase (short-subunit alcohol dehydrogenase family)
MLAGRAALVLGLDDIGTGIARRFAREGAQLCVADPDNRSHAQAVAVELAPQGSFDSDSIEGLVEGAVRQLGGLDVLVCNLLPAPQPRPLAALDVEALDASMARVRTTVAAMRSALPALRDSGRGRILLVGHRYGESVSEALGAYNAAAWSLVGLARSAAVEWGQYQVTTNVLMPLAATVEFEAARSKRPALVDRLVGQLPLRRVGDPVEDVGGAAALIACDAMCFVNGEIIHADGGQHVAGPVLNPVRFTP